jgi:hypothetical protein
MISPPASLEAQRHGEENRGFAETTGAGGIKTTLLCVSVPLAKRVVNLPFAGGRMFSADAP